MPNDFFYFGLHFNLFYFRPISKHESNILRILLFYRSVAGKIGAKIASELIAATISYTLLPFARALTNLINIRFGRWIMKTAGTP